jgi:protein Tex
MSQLSFIQKLSNFESKAIQNTLNLLNEGSTIPFIARYRKEMTGGLDEVEILQIRDLAKKYEELIARQQTILKSIEEQGKLTDELKNKIENCFDSNVLEDIYLPFKQKKLTRGEKAKKARLGTT